MEEAITWVEVLKVGGLAGVISAVIASLLREVSGYLDRRRQARYLALRLSLLFERYFYTCVRHIDDLRDYVSSRGNAGDITPGLPKVPEYPSDSSA